jgi:LuxR family quorum sensing-dependent transcriptional regulator
MELTSSRGWSDEILSFIESLNRLHRADTVVDATQTLISRFGFKNILFSTLPGPTQRYEDVVLGRKGQSEWHKLYLDNQYDHIDPVFRHVRRTWKPFEWRDLQVDAEREPRAAELMRRRRDFGLNNALVVPTLGVAGVVGFVCMSGAHFDVSVFDRPAIHLLALYAFDRVRELRGAGAFHKVPLTPREREVITWVGQGKSAWEIGEILNIAKRTVDEHVQTVCQKLGAANRVHAVAIAIRNGLIEA